VGWTTVKKIDINCDMGESYGNWKIGNDEAVMKYITSANIATGWHAGDPVVMRKTVNRAKQYGVGVGAHPGFPDLMGFGRRAMKLNPEETRCYMMYQLGALKAFTDAAKTELWHVKLHGAWGDALSGDEKASRALIQGIMDINPKMAILHPPVEYYTYMRIAEEMGLPVVGELYVDLNFDQRGRIIVQRIKKPVEPHDMVAKILKFLDTGKVQTVEGKELELDAKSVCIHGDNPRAPEILKVIREELKKQNVEVVHLSAFIK